MATQRNWAKTPKLNTPAHYYEGFVEKKTPLEKDYKRYWAGLHGLTLYFYNTSRDAQHVEQIDLDNFVALTDNNTPRSDGVWSTAGARLTLKTRTQEVELKLESLASREMWKGIILTVVELKVPSSLTLLPGHLYMLSEALEKERERQSKLSPAEPREEKEIPECFFRVSRTEAEVLLEKNETCGNMLLRPGGDGKSVAVTTRQKVNRIVTIKHYKINVDGGDYVIDVDEPFRCPSLAGVVDFFVSSSKNLLVPLSLDESYAATFEIMELDKESGESISKPAQMPRVSPKLWKGGVGEEKGPASPRSQTPLPPLPPLPRAFPVKPPIPTREDQSEHVYLQEDPPEQTYMNEDIKGTASPVFGETSQGPGGPKTIRRIPGHLVMPLPRSFSVEMSEELERKLQKRRAALQE